MENIHGSNSVNPPELGWDYQWSRPVEARAWPCDCLVPTDPPAFLFEPEGDLGIHFFEHGEFLGFDNEGSQVYRGTFKAAENIETICLFQARTSTHGIVGRAIKNRRRTM